MLTVLLASDDAGTRLGTGRAFRRSGYHVSHVTNFHLAADGADLDDVDAIVVGLDQQIRREEFIRRVRLRDRQTPIVAVMDSPVAWQVRRLRAMGAQRVLTGPVQPADLLAEVDSLVDAPAPGRSGPLPHVRERAARGR